MRCLKDLYHNNTCLLSPIFLLRLRSRPRLTNISVSFPRKEKERRAEKPSERRWKEKRCEWEINNFFSRSQRRTSETSKTVQKFKSEGNIITSDDGMRKLQKEFLRLSKTFPREMEIPSWHSKSPYFCHATKRGEKSMTKLIREEGSCISEGTAADAVTCATSEFFLPYGWDRFRFFTLNPNDYELRFCFFRKASVRLLTLDVVAQLSQTALPLRWINVHLFCIDFSFTSIELRFYSMR